MTRLVTRARCNMRRWQRDTDGVAAIEFAFIVPIMSMMFMGAVELSQAITVDRRVTQIANSTADLVARSETKISQDEISDIMKIGGYIMEPTSAAPLQIILRNVTSSPANATIVKQSWMCTYKGAGGAGGTPTQTCTCTNTPYTMPASLVTTNDSAVVSEVTYAYKPLVFDFFLNKSYGTSGTGGTYSLAQTVYLKPRGQAAMLVQPSGVNCPAPTF